MSEISIRDALKIFENQEKRRLPPSLAVLGPPGSGKSLFLSQLINTIRNDETCTNKHALMIDLRSIPVGSQVEIYFHINQALLQEAASIGISCDFDIRVQISHLRFEEILRHLLSSVSGHLVIFIDHLESVPRLFASDLSHRFRNFLETTEQDSEYGRLGLVIGGAVSLYDLKHGPNSAFQMLQVMSFPQTQPETRQLLVEDYLKNYMSAEIPSELTGLLADLTGGEPGFLEPLIMQLLKAGRQISLDENLVLASVEEICSYSQVPVLRNLALHLWGDKALRDLVRDLKQSRTVMPRFAVPDIDRFQLSGAVVVGRSPQGKSDEYQFRNRITAKFLDQLYNLLEATDDRSKAQLSIWAELEKLETAKLACLNAQHVWAWLRILGESWVAITPYNLPQLSLYVTKPGSQLGWWLDAEVSTVFGPEVREMDGNSKKLATFTALENMSLAFGADAESIKAFIESDADRISIAMPLYAREVTIIMVATLSRTDAGRGLTEFDLCHWIRFLQNVKQVARGLTLAELGLKLLEENTDEADAKLELSHNPVTYICMLPNGNATIKDRLGLTFISGSITNKDIEGLNASCLDLVDRWTDQRNFESRVAGIAHQFDTALVARFSSLIPHLAPGSQAQEVVIASDREGLKIPFELFPSGESHLATVKGVSRQIIGYQMPPEASFSFDRLLSSLVGNKQELGVLLVASNVDRDLSQATEELQRVRHHIEAGCRRLNVRPRIVEISPGEATVSRVETELVRNGPYQLFHYTGHGRHYSEDADASGVVLLGEQGEVEVVKCKRLSLWLKQAKSWLVYLSCCHSSASSGEGAGLSSKYVGMIDAIVAAGIPNVVGFRCLVSDRSAYHLADEFYRQLFEEQNEKNLSLALLEARRSVQRRGDFFDAWASSMLVTQYS
jgi:hypothetical protein